MKDESQGRASAAAADSASASSPITVKKYANRRLYNTATSSYITLENLAAMVRDGQDFVVQDAKTGEDITRTVLTQIIFEEESRGRAPMLPISFLRQLIRLYGDTLQSYVPSYLEMTMRSFEHNREAFRAQLERSFGVAPGYKHFEAMSRANMDMFRNAMEMFSTPFQAVDAARATGQPSARPPAKAASEEASEEDGDRRADDVAALKRQLAEMQRKIDSLSDD